MRKLLLILVLVLLCAGCGDKYVTKEELGKYVTKEQLEERLNEVTICSLLKSNSNKEQLADIVEEMINEGVYSWWYDSTYSIEINKLEALYDHLELEYYEENKPAETIRGVRKKVNK